MAVWWLLGNVRLSCRQPPGARLVELNLALARAYDNHRLLSGLNFDDFALGASDDGASEPCKLNPRFHLCHDSGTPVLIAACAACGFRQPVL